MAIAASGELIQKTNTAMGSSSALLSPEELEFAALQAVGELNWKYPIEEPRAQYWAIQRSKRHAIDILRVQSARKFQFKNLSLQHTFRQYHDLIKEMDDEFHKALDSEPLLMNISPEAMFGLSIENNIVYDQYGRDVSKILNYYDIDNEGFRHRII